MRHPHPKPDDGAIRGATQSQSEPEIARAARSADPAPSQCCRHRCGSASPLAAAPPDRDDCPLREFAGFTDDLNALADWLKACGVDTIAMESTGMHWIPLYELLQSRGLRVLLVNAQHVKNVSGRKSDVLDCQWLQQPMSYGLLRGAFRPDKTPCFCVAAGISHV